jgi:HSP20 family molecular chaperone IbpA
MARLPQTGSRRMCRFCKGMTMSKISFGSHPYQLGFEQLERLVERSAKGGGEGYPPFNIEAVAENAYRITLAVAGFREEELAITVEDRQLVIRGRQAEDEGGKVYLHRGIASRAFQRSFVLADGVEVAGATMEHGLLHVDLRRHVPETVVQTIRIGRKDASHKEGGNK